MIRVIVPFYSEFETCKPGLRSLRASDIPFDFCPIQGTYIYAARNYGVVGSCTDIHQEVAGPFTHFLFVDSDVGFDARDVRLALSLKAPIVTHPYLRHENDGAYQCGRFTADRSGVIASRYTKSEVGLRHVDWCGAGFLLVRRDVFPLLEYPYFKPVAIQRGNQAEVIGEDIGFCLNALKAKVPILCNFDRPVFHKQRKPEHFDVDY